MNSASEPSASDGGAIAGKTVVVTGASAGIGAALARQLSTLDARVVVVGRSPAKTRTLADSIGAAAHLVDYSSFGDVRRLAAELLETHPRIDILVNNAGQMFPRRTTTDDGHEMSMQVNYLSPVLLTSLLLDRLSAAPDARVLFTGSSAYRRGRLDPAKVDTQGRRYRGVKAYGTAKLATLLYMQELARRTEGSALTTCAVHPGAVATDVGRDSALVRWVVRLGRPMLLSPDAGAKPILRLATLASPRQVNGQYFHRERLEVPMNPQARDQRLAEDMWHTAHRLVGLVG
jgi:NAD(P)-dependent dehydrogenase (short-subunit alcohol dehydrogenase family)